MKRTLFYILFLITIIVLSACESRQTRDILFDDEYPPLREVAYTVGGQTYNIMAFEGQCVLFFNDNISQLQAETIIKEYSGKIIEQVPAFNYYLVEVSVGSESDFVTRMRTRDDVIYSFLNMPFLQTSQVYILDGFKDVEKNLLTTHGDAVKRVFSKYGMGQSIHCVNLVGLESVSPSNWETVKQIVKVLAGNNTIGELLNIAKKATSNDFVLINISLGVELIGKSKKRDLYSDVAEQYQEGYKVAYAEELKGLAACMEKMRRKGTSNFIVTKSSGNEGYHYLDDIINSLDDETICSLKKNMVLVNAYDNKKDIAGVWYSNLPNKKHELCTTIDITPEEGLSGTSFAAPKLLGFIDKVITEYEILNAQDVLQAIRNATPDNPREPMTYEMLEREAKKLLKRQCKQYIYILDMTSNYSGEWDLSDGKKKDVIRYQVHDTYCYEYLSGQKMAIDVENCTAYDIEIFLNAIETEKSIRPIRYYLSRGERQSFYAYNHETMDIISVNKLEVKVTTW